MYKVFKLVPGREPRWAVAASPLLGKDFTSYVEASEALRQYGKHDITYAIEEMSVPVNHIRVVTETTVVLKCANL